MIRDLVESVRFPTTNDYYEKSSIDGYAFLGCARSRLNLDITDCLKAVRERVRGLNDEYRIYGTVVPKDAIYIYSSFPVLEFYLSIGDAVPDELRKKIIDDVDMIGRYENNMVRYCTTETNYIVPNVTAIAALMYARMRRIEEAKLLVNVLKTRQEKGNWRYQDASTGKYLAFEDSMHLAMITYCLQKLDKEYQIETHDLVDNSLKRLRKMNRFNSRNKIGWNTPWVLLTFINQYPKKTEKLFDFVRNHAINHENFRTRAIAAWSLSQIPNEWDK